MWRTITLDTIKHIFVKHLRVTSNTSKSACFSFEAIKTQRITIIPRVTTFIKQQLRQLSVK